MEKDNIIRVKVGDKVRCLKDFSKYNIEIHQIYEVTELISDHAFKLKGSFLRWTNPLKSYYFELVSSQNNNVFIKRTNIKKL